MDACSRKLNQKSLVELSSFLGGPSRSHLVGLDEPPESRRQTDELPFKFWGFPKLTGNKARPNLRVVKERYKNERKRSLTPPLPQCTSYHLVENCHSCVPCACLS